MSDFAEVVIIVEGRTEEIFINSLLKKYLAEKQVYVTPIQISKPGQKGGDVKFSRAVRDIGIYLKQRRDTFISLFFDYYAIHKDWPGLEEAQKESEPIQIATIVNGATHTAVNKNFSDYRSDIRFIPHVAVHEFESLLFSAPDKLAPHLNINRSKISKIVNSFGDPEKINNSRETAPSKRLKTLFPRYKKTTTGITIAREIGINSMRKECKVFHHWISRLEALAGKKS